MRVEIHPQSQFDQRRIVVNVASISLGGVGFCISFSRLDQNARQRQIASRPRYIQDIRHINEDEAVVLLVFIAFLFAGLVTVPAVLLVPDGAEFLIFLLAGLSFTSALMTGLVWARVESWKNQLRITVISLSIAALSLLSFLPIFRN